jgi:hypothetical protein
MTRFEWMCVSQWPSHRRRAPRACNIALFCLVFFAFASGPACAGEIDRLIVAVNGKVITEGDLDLGRSLYVLLSYNSKAAARSRNDEINRLIDRELLRQELKSFSLTQEDERKVAVRMQSLREAYAEKGGLPALLRQLGLQESELFSYLQFESAILKFVDFRFRPFVIVSEAEIQSYYEEKLVPQLLNSGIEVPVRTQVSARIKEILREEKINAALERWISDIRRSSRIEYFGAAK